MVDYLAIFTKLKSLTVEHTLLAPRSLLSLPPCVETIYLNRADGFEAPEIGWFLMKRAHSALVSITMKNYNYTAEDRQLLLVS